MYSFGAMKPAAIEAVHEGELTTSTPDQASLSPDLKGILIQVPEAIKDSQKNQVVDYHQDFVVKEIDDSLIARFDFETFNHLKFTAWKKIKLFFEHTFPYFTQSFFNPIFRLIYGSV
ncbi:MAG: hypothetical protein RIQ72_140, partial [Candidatus Parcubacteria bacterium]